MLREDYRTLIYFEKLGIRAKMESFGYGRPRPTNKVYVSVIFLVQNGAGCLHIVAQMLNGMVPSSSLGDGLCC